MASANGISYRTAMNDLPAVKRFRRRLGGVPVRVEEVVKCLHLPGPERWNSGSILGRNVAVLDSQGRDLTKPYDIVAADDSTPQFPDGEPGVLVIRVDDDDAPLPAEWWQEFHWGDFPKEGRPRSAHLRAPGIKIYRKG